MPVVVSVSLGRRPSAKLVQALLTGLALASLEQMRERRLPSLYASGVRYARERGREQWQTAEETLRLLSGDCEDLTAYRCAELWIAGEVAARPLCYAPRPGLIHCVVRRGSGVIEDPSKLLGMSGKG